MERDELIERILVAKSHHEQALHEYIKFRKFHPNQDWSGLGIDLEEMFEKDAEAVDVLAKDLNKLGVDIHYLV
jgi:hypothetical protein